MGYSLRDSIVRQVSSPNITGYDEVGAPSYGPTMNDGNKYYNPATDDPGNEDVANRIYQQRLGEMSWKDLLKANFQEMGGSMGSPDLPVYDNIVKRLEATGWSDEQKKQAILKGADDHFSAHKSGFTGWSPEEGVAGVLGLPDYDQAKHDEQGRQYSEAHTKYSAAEDARSLGDAIKLASVVFAPVGAAMMGPGAGATAGVSESALAGFDIALGGAGGSAGAASLSAGFTAGSGSVIGGWLQETFGNWGKAITETFGKVTDFFSPSGAGPVTDAGVESVVNTAMNSGGNSGLIEGATNVSTSPIDLVHGPDASWGVNPQMTAAEQAGEIATGSGAPAAETTAAEQMFAEGARAVQAGGTAAGAPTNSGGLIDQVIKFGKENPMVTSTVMQTFGGLLKGMGDRKTAEDLMDKRIAGEMALQESKVQNAVDLENAKRSIIQGSSYFDANVNMRPSGKVLKRPDGSLVYAPGGGLVASQMGG
jgi:hypothetical protein